MKKKVLIIVPKLSNGGTEKVAASLSYYLDPDKYDITFLLFFNDKIDFDYKGEIEILNLISGKSTISKLYTNIARYIKVKAFKKKLNPSATISFESGPNILNILTRHGDKTILTVHFCKSEEDKDFYKRVYDWLIKKMYNSSTYIVGVSRLIKNDLEVNYHLSPDKVKTIYNFYNTSKINSLSKIKLDKEYEQLFTTKRVIINVGRLTYQKGQWHLIKAFSKLKEKYSDIALVLLGVGEMEDELKELIKKLSLDEVYLLGFDSNPFKYVGKSFLFALPSMYEGFPNVLVESLSCETVVVSSDCKSGPRELLDPKSSILDKSEEVIYGEYGVLIPRFGKEINLEISLEQEDILLSSAIDSLLSNEELYLSYKNKSLERAKMFDGKSIIRDYEKLIDD
ncbi:MAG: glycosyl transferase [Candidatus Delongbacteria bacterium]|nr:MAG: glycosyl transferase [Candidatus Delongbacteria bacterium]